MTVVYCLFFYCLWLSYIHLRNVEFLIFMLMLILNYCDLLNLAHGSIIKDIQYFVDIFFGIDNRQSVKYQWLD